MDHGDHGDHGSGTNDGGHGGMDNGEGGMDNGEGGMDMSMFFHFGVKETILFEGWKTTTTNELLVAVLIVGAVAALYEGIKHSRELLFRSSITRKSTLTLPGSTTALHSKQTEPACAESMFSSTHLIQTLLHAAQFTISYLLMLVFMTYNVWLCIGVIVGATLGFYLFGWRLSSAVSITEHCH